jgi:hypothetical protein
LSAIWRLAPPSPWHFFANLTPGRHGTLIDALEKLGGASLCILGRNGIALFL